MGCDCSSGRGSRRGARLPHPGPCLPSFLSSCSRPAADLFLGGGRQTAGALSCPTSPRPQVPEVCSCLTDGASGACEGVRGHLLLKGASTLVQSSLDYCGEERGVRGSLPTPGRLCLGLSSSEAPDAPCPRPTPSPRAPGSPAASPQALWAGSALRVSPSPSKTQVDSSFGFIRLSGSEKK